MGQGYQTHNREAQRITTAWPLRPQAGYISSNARRDFIESVEPSLFIDGIDGGLLRRLLRQACVRWCTNLSVLLTYFSKTQWVYDPFTPKSKSEQTRSAVGAKSENRVVYSHEAQNECHVKHAKKPYTRPICTNRNRTHTHLKHLPRYCEAGQPAQETTTPYGHTGSKREGIQAKKENVSWHDERNNPRCEQSIFDDDTAALSEDKGWIHNYTENRATGKHDDTHVNIAGGL